MISDDELLELIESGKIRVANPYTPSPELFTNGRRRIAELVRQRGRMRIADSVARYAWRIHAFGKRRRIVRAKLVYMYVYRVIVPADWQIHHKDGNRLNDAIDNLEAIHVSDHKAIHYDLEY